MPVLQTERLLLRCFDAGDATFIHELLNDPGWLRHIGDRGIRSADDARLWIATRLVDGYRRQGHGFWAVHRREDPKLIGLCGFIKRDTLPEVDVGYAFMPAYRGQGYALEAVQGCLQHGREVLCFKRVLAITSPDNIASQRLLVRAGMRLEDRRALAGEARETWVYAWGDEASTG